MRKTAIALSGVAVAGVLSLVTWTMARSRSSEPSGGAAQWQPAAGDGGASASASDAGWKPPVFDTFEDPRYKAGIPMRPMDHDIIAAVQSGKVERKDVLDLFPDKPYRVRLVGSPASQTFVYVLIQMDRTAKQDPDPRQAWDERWDLREPGTIKRYVFRDPNAQGEQVMYTLTKGRWQPH